MNARRFSARQSERFIAKRRTRIMFGGAGGVVALSLCIYVLSAMSSWSALSIHAIRIVGADARDAETMQAAALTALQGTYLGLFSRDNAIIYPRRTIEDRIKQTSPEVQSVSISRDSLTALAITITEKTPAALVCTTLPDFEGSDLSLGDPDTCYFADATGRIFKKAPSFSGPVYNRYYAPDLDSGSSTQEIIGSSATSTDEFVRIQHVYDSVKAGGITVDAILMKGDGEYELYGRNPGSIPSTVVIYFNTHSSTDEQVSNLMSFWKHMVEDARAKGTTVEFDSIDVRYGSNVFYRLMK